MKKKKGILKMALSFALNNLLAVVLCLMLMTLFSFVLSSNFSWIIHILMLVSFTFLIYHQAWQYGSGDLDNKFGKRTKVAVCGSLVATAPNFLMAILSFLIDMGVYTPAFNFSGQATVTSVFRFWNMSFQILFDGLAAIPALYFIPCIAMPVFATIGYIFGYKQLKLSDYIYYAREEKE